jgi:hypothetical protein
VIEHLLDAVRGHLIALRLQVLGVIHVLEREFGHAQREGRGEQHRQALLRRRHASEQVADIGDEAEIEHAVRLVEHRRLELLEVEDALFEVIDQAPGRADEHVAAGRDVFALALVVRAAIRQSQA